MNPRNLLMRIITKLFYGRGLGKYFGLREWYHKQAKKSVINKVTINGYTLFLNKHDSQFLSIGNIPHPQTTVYFKKNIKLGETFVDVGANVGYFTILASRLVGEKGKVIAIEPNKDNFDLLTKNVKHNKCDNVKLVNSALTSYDGEIEFFDSLESAGDHSLINHSGTPREKVIVKCNKLDSIVTVNKEKMWIKIDVQGAEHLVLRGATKTLKNNEKCVLILEDEYTVGRSKPMFYGILNDLNIFRRIDLDSGSFGKNKTCNAVYSLNLVSNIKQGRKK